MIPPPAIIEQVTDFGPCPCATCKRLDKRFPGEGYQLALFPFRVQLRPRPARLESHP